MGYLINEQLLERYADHLRSIDRSEGTILKYCRDIRNAARWLEGRPATAALLAQWRDELVEELLTEYIRTKNWQ